MSTQGQSGHSSDNQRSGSGNFANDPERASEAGKKGGQHSHSGSQGGTDTSKGTGSGGNRTGSGHKDTK